MKLDIASRKFHTHDIEGKKSYAVANTPHMMRILGESLYEDKILACVRELSTNAFESHFRAKNPKPFHVYLPTREKTNFRVRDFGTGLTKTQLSTLYNVFGASDKGDSNEFTGCLGLGSKAPFSYQGNGGTFITTSYINGIKHIVVNAKDSRGKPTMVMLKSEPTNEPNGVEVSFDVKIQDVDEFAEKAADIYKWFKIRPICKQGSYEEGIDEYEYDYDKPTWKLARKRRSYYGSGSSKAIMGQVAYNINEDHFSGDHLTILNLGKLHLFFKIGEIEMAPSREGLQYHEHTINAIKKRLDEILKYFHDMVSEKIKNCSSLWDARVLLSELTDGELSFLKGLSEKVLWKGESVSTSIKVIDCNITKFEKANSYRYRYGSDSRGMVVRQENDASRINASKKALLYYNDMKRGAVTACKDKIRDDNNIDAIYLVRDKDELNKFKELLGATNGAVKPSSDLPYNAPTRSGRTGGKLSTVFKLKDSEIHSYNNRNAWDSTSVEIDNETGVYCPMYNWQIEVGNTYLQNYDVQELIKCLKKLGINVPKFIGIRRNATKKFVNSSNWTRIDKWLENQVDKLLTEDLKKIIFENQRALRVSDKAFYKNIFPYLSESESDVYKLAKMVANAPDIADNERWNACTQANRLCLRITGKSKIDTILNTDDIAKMEERINKDYPLLKHVNCSYSHSKERLKDVADYINLIDKVGV